MNPAILNALDFAQGPLFRAAFALLVLGVIRNALLAAFDAVTAYLALGGGPRFWHKLRLRIAWHVAPSFLLRSANAPHANFAYHVLLDALALIFRIGAIIIPTFMIAHVHLWERGLGLSWPVLSATVTDVGALITIVTGAALFLGRLYSSTIRDIEPPWTFAKPLILVLPFFTGFLAMHPQWSPLSWHFVMLLHVCSACLVFIMIPFARLLASMHMSITDVLPEAAWMPDQDHTSTPQFARPETGVTS